MSVTTLAYFVVLTRAWRWSLVRALPLCLFFLAVDLAFVVANLHKFFDGSWVPFCVRTGRLHSLHDVDEREKNVIAKELGSRLLPLDVFLQDVAIQSPPRVRGVAVFLTANSGGVPVLLLHHFKHNQVLHEKVVLLTITSAQTPFVKASERVEVEDLELGFYRLIARFGYMETPNVPGLTQRAR